MMLLPCFLLATLPAFPLSCLRHLTWLARNLRSCLSPLLRFLLLKHTQCVMCNVLVRVTSIENVCGMHVELHHTSNNNSRELKVFVNV